MKWVPRIDVLATVVVAFLLTGNAALAHDSSEFNEASEISVCDLESIPLASDGEDPDSDQLEPTHGGGLNSCGCHYNRSTGECHCHQDRGCGCACQPARCR
jgi:hypothetical protein